MKVVLQRQISGNLVCRKKNAAALQKQIAQDGIQQLFVMRQPGSESEHELLLMSLLSQSELQLEMIQKPPFF